MTVILRAPKSVQNKRYIWLGIVIGLVVGHVFRNIFAITAISTSNFTVFSTPCQRRTPRTTPSLQAAKIRSSFTLRDPPTTFHTTNLVPVEMADTTKTRSLNDPWTQPSFWSFWGRHTRPRSTKSYFGIDKIYISHWSELKDRRKLMEERMTSVFGNEWNTENFVSFVTELDAADITSEDAVKLACGPSTEPEPVWTFRDGIIKGALSLSAKHHIAYFDALVHGYNVILILEDDAEFVPDFGNNVKEVLESLPSGWSNCMIANPWREIIPCKYSRNNDKVCLQPQGSGSSGTVAYLMSLDGCRRMMDGLPIMRHSDWQMNLVSENDPSFITFRTIQDIASEDKANEKGSWRKDELNS